MNNAKEPATWYVRRCDWAGDAPKVEHQAELWGFLRVRVERVEDGREDHASLEREELKYKIYLEYTKNGESKSQNKRHLEKTKLMNEKWRIKRITW